MPAVDYRQSDAWRPPVTHVCVRSPIVSSDPIANARLASLVRSISASQRPTDGSVGRMPPPIFFRQSTASDLGAMAKRAGTKHLMLTHLIPPIGTRQGPWTIPGAD